jgi:hypothetical protein
MPNLLLPIATVPVPSVPMKQVSTVLPLAEMLMPLPVKLLIIRP